PHPRHAKLPCLTCHAVNRPTGSKGGLTFETPRGCDLCHHQKVLAGKIEARDCAACHRTERLASALPAEVRVGTGTRPPVARQVGFRHNRHEKVTCEACHLPAATVPPDSVRTCQACHQQHHVDARDCTQCHNVRTTTTAHTRATHVRCDACHTPARIAALVPNRPFCLTCHTAQRDHWPAGECSTCHFLRSPAEYRRHLTGGRPR
ncbi:MAG: hypothetical protein HOP28_04320, partial [Gemmatimonadales bacterium]|nr:hypothetical protein [Gemmatimonadales bacterium]